MKARILIVVGLLLALGAANFAIQQREGQLRDGQPVLLALAPVDPRSIMQGDYMILRYALADQILSQRQYPVQENAYAVLRLDGRGVAELLRLQAEPTPLAEGEHLLRYRVRGYQIRAASEAWFFQEGQAARFEAAAFAELRLDRNGRALLAGLRDRDLQPL